MDTINVTADADALRSRAAQLIAAGRLGAARPLLAAAQAMSPPSAELTLMSVRLALGSDACERAIQELDDGIAASPAHGGLRKCRADLRQKIGDFEGAARDASEAVIADRNDPEAKAILGAALLDLGLLTQAIACLDEAVTGAPAELDYRQTLSIALEKAGDADAALMVLTDGIALFPASVTMRNAAILFCVRHRDFKQALTLAEQARSKGVADACTFGLQGHALSSLGQHDKAAIAYQEALKLGPDDPYVKHLVISSGARPDSKRAPEGYVRTIFDGYADRFENHIISLGYGIPACIRSLLLDHPKIACGQAVGPVLDLGCGTGMVGLAIGDLPVGSITGVDLSPRMLMHARAKGIYAELREADIVTDLETHQQRWPLITAGDVLCYFGALEELLDLVHQRLEPGGWFAFSVEEVRADRDGVLPGNGNWALQRQGRYVHSELYVDTAVRGAGFRVVRMDRRVIRQEGGTGVVGLLWAVERTRHDS